MSGPAAANADPFNLQRFVDAQAAVYEQARTELSRGQKTSHWMWFIFPQITGLGSSPMAVRYAIRSLDEAKAYLKHPLLGPRLHECCGLLARHVQRPIGDILPWPDDLKLNSSLTLFSRASTENQTFLHLIDGFFNGKLDEHTLDLLS